jgi:hypothetical protein
MDLTVGQELFFSAASLLLALLFFVVALTRFKASRV